MRVLRKLPHKQSLLVAFVMLNLMCISGCYTPSGQIKKSRTNPYAKLDRLAQLNDLNERAYAYHQHCLQKTEPINQKFMENFAFSANMLTNALMEIYNWNDEFAINQILQRRRNTQNTLTQHYNTKGCQSNEGQLAQQHYISFSNINQTEIRRHL